MFAQPFDFVNTSDESTTFDNTNAPVYDGDGGEFEVMGEFYGNDVAVDNNGFFYVPAPFGVGTCGGPLCGVFGTLASPWFCPHCTNKYADDSVLYFHDVEVAAQRAAKLAQYVEEKEFDEKAHDDLFAAQAAEERATALRREAKERDAKATAEEWADRENTKAFLTAQAEKAWRESETKAVTVEVKGAEAKTVEVKAKVVELVGADLYREVRSAVAKQLGDKDEKWIALGVDHMTETFAELAEFARDLKTAMPSESYILRNAADIKLNLPWFKAENTWSHTRPDLTGVMAAALQLAEANANQFEKDSAACDQLLDLLLHSMNDTNRMSAQRPGVYQVGRAQFTVKLKPKRKVTLAFV